MLQQTQVSRVLPKFLVWMKKYPTLLSLRKSTLLDVLLLWKGLGYQRRAKALIEIAKTVTILPSTTVELQTLPGIGIYTASAITAFAYNVFDHPVLETNIRTVLIEFFYKNKTKLSDTALYQNLRRLEEYSLVKKFGARMWYYALMDYGSYLKANNISHNIKSKHYTKQTPYRGSLRELRASTLFAIAQNKKLPDDKRLEQVLKILSKENYIVRTKKKEGEKFVVKYTIT